MQLIPNVVLYENWTLIDHEHIELPYEKQKFLEDRGHELEAISEGAICQFIVQDVGSRIYMGRKNSQGVKENLLRGILTAVSDPRKNGRPAAV